jgi:hypothetical protein
MKKELLALTASLALVSSLSASINHTAINSNKLGISSSTAASSLIAREAQPGDDRGKHKGGKDDRKGHKFATEIAREQQPGDDRGKHKGGKDDRKGHKFATEIAREAQPGDDRGKHKGGKDDRKGHKFA